MEKSIMIPTDFTVKSLHPVREALENNKSFRLKIVLVHGIQLSISITDLLFFSKSRIINEMKSEDFNSSCELLQSRYSNQLHSIRIDLFTGGVQSVFDTFLKESEIDEIYFFDNHEMQKSGYKSLDLLPYIEKANLKKYCLQGQRLNGKIESEPLADLLFTRTA